MSKKAVEPNGNIAINEDEGPVVLKLSIPADLYAEYEDLAYTQQLTVAELMLDRIKRCKGHSSIRSLYFTTLQLSQLEGILQKRPIADSTHALALLQAALSVRVGDFEPIPISASQAKRLALAAYGGLTVQDHLARVIQGAIAKATGT